SLRNAAYLVVADQPATIQNAIGAASDAAFQAILDRLPEAVLQQNFFPNPRGKPKLANLEGAINTITEPFMRRASYTREEYKALYEQLPPAKRESLPHPDNIRVDKMTLMLAEVPAGLEDILADIHAHSMGYDRRSGDHFMALLTKSGETSRI